MDTLGGVTNVDFRFKMREAQKISGKYFLRLKFFWDAFPKEKKGHFEPKSASQGQKMLYGSLIVQHIACTAHRMYSTKRPQPQSS